MPVMLVALLSFLIVGLTTSTALLTQCSQWRKRISRTSQPERGGGEPQFPVKNESEFPEKTQSTQTMQARTRRRTASNGTANGKAQRPSAPAKKPNIQCTTSEPSLKTARDEPLRPSTSQISSEVPTAGTALLPTAHRKFVPQPSDVSLTAVQEWEKEMRTQFPELSEPTQVMNTSSTKILRPDGEMPEPSSNNNNNNNVDAPPGALRDKDLVLSTHSSKIHTHSLVNRKSAYLEASGMDGNPGAKGIKASADACVPPSTETRPKEAPSREKLVRTH